MTAVPQIVHPSTCDTGIARPGGNPGLAEGDSDRRSPERRPAAEEKSEEVLVHRARKQALVLMTLSALASLALIIAAWLVLRSVF